MDGIKIDRGLGGRAALQPANDARAWLSAAISALAVAWAYADVIVSLVKTWWDQPDYSHGFFVGPVALAIAWRLRPAASEGAGPSWFGLVALALALGARIVFHESGEFFAERATLPLAVAALVYAHGGWPLIRRTWPAAAFLVFALPVPAGLDARIAQPLQRIAATASGEVLRLSGFWVLNEGNTLAFGTERLEVATACNGLAMLMSLAATVVAMVLLVEMSQPKRLVVLASLMPIALSCNVLRIVTTALGYRYFSAEQARAFAHDAAGWLMMPIALALVWLELRWLAWVADDQPAAAPAVSPGE